MQNVTNLQDLVLLLQVFCGEAQLHRLRHREQVFLSLVAISYSLDPSPAGLTIVLSHQEELISSPSIPRVFFTTVSSQSRVPESVSNIFHKMYPESKAGSQVSQSETGATINLPPQKTSPILGWNRSSPS